MSVDPDFFRQKIKKLSDQELPYLLQKTGNGVNPEIYQIAKREASDRNLEYERKATIKTDEKQIDDATKQKLDQWNWGAFLLAPFWTLANKLESWTILCFIPVINIGVSIYLGYNGNKLAFPKSLNSVDDFMTIQKEWGRRGVRLFWLGLLAGLIAFLVHLFAS